MGHRNVLEGVEGSVTDTLMLEDTGPLLRIATVMVVVTDIQVTGDSLTVPRGVSEAQEDHLLGTEAEEAGQKAGVCHEALPIVVVVIAEALSVADPQLTLPDTVHLLALRSDFLHRAGAGAGARALQNHGPRGGLHLQKELAGRGQGRRLAVHLERKA